MFDNVKVTMAGITRSVPRTMLSAMKSMGWKELGADPVVEEKTKSPQLTVKNKEKKNVKIPQGQ
jgi:hypothetical protein